MKQVRVNVTTKVNSSSIRRERHNGRDVIVVPSATMPDEVVMNGIKYPADEIAKSYASLERTPAPLGHPTINGAFVSAMDPEGINRSYIGAYNANVTRDRGRVFLDKIIDVEFASQTNGGKAVLAAIEQGEPIHTSTGLLCMLEAVANAEDHEYVARDIVFDHDAILLGEDGAATPAQGVGMLVNGARVDVINSTLSQVESEIDWAGMRLVDAITQRDKATAWERIKSAIMEAISTSAREPETSTKDDDMTVTTEQFDQLSAKVNALAETLSSDKVSELVTNAVAAAIKPVTDDIAAVKAANAAKEETEKADLVAKIVKANTLSEEAAKGLTLEALRELAPKAKPGAAAPLNAAFTGGAKSATFKLPEGE